MTAFDSLLSEWQSDASALERRGAGREAAILRACASELVSALRAEEDALLDLAEAAAVSGYSSDHLARLIRKGQLVNRGRKGNPRLRSGDLPRKIATLRGQSYDPDADAQDLLTQRSTP